MGNYIPLGKLQTYLLSRSLSRLVWGTYKNTPKKLQWSIGDQIIRSGDSVGANIAEGYGRFHYRDRARFYYQARGSLIETQHWFSLLSEREIITHAAFDEAMALTKQVSVSLNQLITSIKDKGQ